MRRVQRSRPELINSPYVRVYVYIRNYCPGTVYLRRACTPSTRSNTLTMLCRQLQIWLHLILGPDFTVETGVLDLSNNRSTACCCNRYCNICKHLYWRNRCFTIRACHWGGPTPESGRLPITTDFMDYTRSGSSEQMGFWATIFKKRFALCYRTADCLSCLTVLSYLFVVTLVYCGQTAEWIRMPLGSDVPDCKFYYPSGRNRNRIVRKLLVRPSSSCYQLVT